MAPGFRTSVWDPTLITGQIVCLQSTFYSTMASIMLLYSAFSAYRPSLDHVFTQQTMRPMTAIQLASSVLCAFAISLIVGRARQCLDFTCTLYCIHILLCCFYNGSLPSQLMWWLLQLINVSICTVLSEYLCMRKETLEIPLYLPPSSANNRPEDRESLLTNTTRGND